VLSEGHGGIAATDRVFFPSGTSRVRKHKGEDRVRLKVRNSADREGTCRVQPETRTNELSLRSQHFGLVKLPARYRGASSSAPNKRSGDLLWLAFRIYSGPKFYQKLGD